MLRVVSVPGATCIPCFVAKCLQEGCSVVMTQNHIYRIVSTGIHLGFMEGVVVRFPRKHSDTSAALIVARVIEE